MLKYRVEFKPSRLLVILQLFTYVVLVLSVLSWQYDIMAYQFFFQALVMCIMSFFFFRSALYSGRQLLSSIILSQSGEWLETNKENQVVWKITNKSRCSSLLLFIHLISPLNVRHSKWCLIYKDQVNERDFRRLCRAVIYQQQISWED